MSFGLRLFFELTQLTGLYFIYPKPYRFFEVDDLIPSTIGGMLGFAVAPLLNVFLPKRDELDEKVLRRSMQVSIVRRNPAATTRSAARTAYA